MKIEKLILLSLFAALSYSCSNSENKTVELSKKEINIQNKYSNVINIKGEISSYRDINTTLFSDLGAWHAYALHYENDGNAGFSGPMLMDQGGKWISENFAKITIRNEGVKIDLSQANRKIDYYPGKLEVIYKAANIVLTQTLIFTDDRNSIIRNSIKNISDEKINLELYFEGEIMDGNNIEIKQTDDKGLSVQLDNKSRYFEQIFIPQPKTILIQDSMQSYIARFDKVNVEKGDVIDYYCKQKHDFEKSNFNDINFEKALIENKERWNQYLSSYFSNKSIFLEKESHQRLAVKSIITLISNWRSAAKDLLHDGTFPSISYQGFYGFWSWDSWKHAVAYADFAPEIAKDNFRSMFDYQDEYGMVADCIYTDKSENNWRDTKPPLASWGVWRIYEVTEDREFLEEMFPKLEAYHSWWYENRDHDTNGLCEYGSTDGTRVAAAWESGMDNAVRFDDAIMLKNNDVAWSLNQESVDLNTYLYSDKLFLANIADILDQNEKAKEYRSQAEELKKSIVNLMYNNEKGYFYDISLENKNQILIDGPEGWIPMWANMIDEKMAENVSKTILDSTKFNTKVPFPTLSASHEKFNPLKGYWRGPVWLDQAYFGIKGLRNYGFNEEANILTLKIINNSEGLLDDKPIRENYHPISGKGLNAKNFSWSSAHILMMLKGK